jgi:hypothetical protein
MNEPSWRRPQGKAVIRMCLLDVEGELPVCVLAAGLPTLALSVDNLGVGVGTPFEGLATDFAGVIARVASLKSLARTAASFFEQLAQCDAALRIARQCLDHPVGDAVQRLADVLEGRRQVVVGEELEDWLRHYAAFQARSACATYWATSRPGRRRAEGAISLDQLFGVSVGRPVFAKS